MRFRVCSPHTPMGLLMGLFVWSVFVASIPAQTKDGPQEPGFTISTDVRLVQLHLTVEDSRGRRVAGLTRDNFVVYDEGERQEISLFQAENVPVTVGLVIDNSSSMARERDQVVAAARELAAVSNPEDEMFVVHFSELITLPLPPDKPFTSDPETLLDAVRNVQAAGRTALFEALDVAAERIRVGSYAKRALVLLSDGGDNLSVTTFGEALEAIEQSDAAVYAVNIADELSDDANPRNLRRLTRATGGRTYFPESIDDLPQIARAIAEELKTQYTIGYSAPSEKAAGYRHVEVEAQAPDSDKKLTVRTRQGYYSGVSSP